MTKGVDPTRAITEDEPCELLPTLFASCDSNGLVLLLTLNARVSPGKSEQKPRP